MRVYNKTETYSYQGLHNYSGFTYSLNNNTNITMMNDAITQMKNSISSLLKGLIKRLRQRDDT